MLWTTTAVFVVVIAFGVFALIRGLRRRTQPPPTSASDARLARRVVAATLLTVVILIGLLYASVSTGRAVSAHVPSDAVTIAISGHQWWWEVEYEDAVPSQRVLTANEIHIPTGRQVVLKVTSRDVIHSFWAPNLQGKRDLIPGYTTAIWMQADRAERFRGQCAEFCGRQHAHMAFEIVAEPQADFDSWINGMRALAREPQTETERRGHDVFLAARCAGCHTVRGTAAGGRVGPDLTHVASRSTIAAGTLPNARDHLREWIRDPQASKPGNQMPRNELPGGDMDALLTYLETLK
jgi:cytochrome c oxidase subunit II